MIPCGAWGGESRLQGGAPPACPGLPPPAPTPAPPPVLQAVLLDLFRQLQAQSATIDTLHASLGALDAREQEGRQAAVAANDALQQLEARMVAEQLAAQQQLRDAEARLHNLELLLHGANNLAGRQAALDDIASMLGVNVPVVGVSLRGRRWSRLGAGAWGQVPE